MGKYAETYRYVMMPELYTALTQDKVIKEAALRSSFARLLPKGRKKVKENRPRGPEGVK